MDFAIYAWLWARKRRSATTAHLPDAKPPQPSKLHPKKGEMAQASATRPRHPRDTPTRPKPRLSPFSAKAYTTRLLYKDCFWCFFLVRLGDPLRRGRAIGNLVIVVVVVVVVVMVVRLLLLLLLHLAIYIYIDIYKQTTAPPKWLPSHLAVDSARVALGQKLVRKW